MFLSYLEGSSLPAHYRRPSAQIIFMLLPRGYVACTVALSLLIDLKRKTLQMQEHISREGDCCFFCFHFEAHATCVSTVILLLCFSEQTHTFRRALKTSFPVCWPYITDRGGGQDSIACSHPALSSSHLSRECLIFVSVLVCSKLLDLSWMQPDKWHPGEQTHH